MSGNWFGKIVLLGALIGQIAAPLPAMAREPCGVPQAQGDWPIANQAELGIDPQRLCNLVDRLTALNANIHGVLVVRHGKLAFEHYLSGPDEKWGRPISGTQGPDIKHDVRSVSKSVTSLLAGIALDRRLIPDTERPVVDFFPEYAQSRTPEKERILLYHLLTMSSGIAWDESLPYQDTRNSEVLMNMMPQPYRFVLDQPISLAPGTKWNYSGGDVALLGAIIQKASGQRLEEFARETLFEPLGITDFEWSTMRNGDAAAASGLRLRPRDMAKLGQLILFDGMWNGKRIVAKEWLRQSMVPRFPTETAHYGYLWWIAPFTVANRTVASVEAFGLGGQRIIVMPELDMVVVVTTGRYNIVDGWRVTGALIEDFILPAATGQSPQPKP